jgi:hypothetical protein
VEVLVPSHLPGQFLSPEANRRDDDWGGSLDNRMRFLHRVLAEIRANAPDGFLISLRLAVDESAEGGPDGTECLAVAQRLWQAGVYDLLNLSGVAASTTPGMAELIGSMAQPLAPFLAPVLAFRRQVDAPVAHASRVSDIDTAVHAVESGATDLVGMTRALMADPHLVAKVRRGEAARIRPCVGAAYCIDRIYAGREAFCAHNPATGREEWIPQSIEPSTGAVRRVVVVGGGPAGLEAARVAARRGHEVVLFEAAPRLGGQVLLAARAGWRRDLVGIVEWLADEVRALGVDVRTDVLADAELVRAERPGIVVIASGGVPRQSEVPGNELIVSTWDVLGGSVRMPRTALVYDEEGRHAAISVAQHLAEQGVAVTLACPDRSVGRDLGGVSMPTYLAGLARAGVRLLTDHRLAEVTTVPGGRRAVLHHEYAPALHTEVDAELVIAELGSFPNDSLFHELRTESLNGGEVDPWALRDNVVQPWLSPEYPLDDGAFVLLPVGDAVASRDIHAAIFDSLRLLKDC